MTTMTQQQQAHSPTPYEPQSTSTTSLLMDAASFAQMHEVAKVMATGRMTVPKHLQGNAGDCLAIVMQAMQWGMNPFAVAQKTFQINGVLGYEAQLINAVITARAPTVDRLHFEWFGDWARIIGRFKEVPAKNNPDEKRIVRDWTVKDEEGLGVRVWATLIGEDEPRELTLLLSQAGVRNSPLWGQDPKQQLAYLAIKRWSRLYCPDVILGVYTDDELQERQPSEIDVSPQATPKAHSGSANLKTRLSQVRNADKPVIDGEAKAFDVAACIAQINAMDTYEHLKAFAKTIPKTLGEPAQTQIKEAYQARAEALKAQEAAKYMPKESINAIKTEFTKCGDNESLQSVWDSRVMSHRAAISAEDYAELELAYTAQLDAINA